MQINIKQLILEGYTFGEIIEAVHANHTSLDKRRLKDPTTSYVEGKEIEKNRKKLADEIKDERNHRDSNRKRAADAVDPYAKRKRTQDANFFDNFARARSQTEGKTPVLAKEFKNFNNQKMDKIIKNVPRVISSAKE